MDANLTVIHSGESTTMRAYVEASEFAPFIGILDGKIGIGLLYVKANGISDYIFYEAPLASPLEQVWRAMKILQKLTEVRKDTLGECFLIVKPVFTEDEQGKFNKLSAYFVGKVDILALRTQLLVMNPDHSELSAMANAVEKNKFALEKQRL